jgi:hypothetical protein
MQLRNQAHTIQGVLCVMAFALATSTTAIAMQPALLLSSAFALAGPLNSQEMIAAQQPDAQQPDTSQPDQSNVKPVVVTGKIIKRGSNFVLRDMSGTVYQLDAQDKAEPYAGKSVRVTGRLDAQNKIIQVEMIEEFTA